MPIDTEQLDVDLEAVRALPDWQDEGKRRGLIRSLSANSYAAQDPDQHQAFTSKLWEAADPRSTLQKAGAFIGSATEEVVKSIPAVPAAAALAITDATGQTDTGSGFRLQRGVMDLAEQGFQRAKQFAVGEGAVGATLNPIMGAARLAGLPVPASAQAERDQTLTALKQDIDTGAVPDSVARWLAGDDVGDDPDVQQWQDGLSRGLGEAALKAQGMGTVQPEALDAWLKSDRNPLRGGINDDNTDFSTRDMLADYLATRDPQSWNAFTNRVAETDGQYQTRIGRAVREGTQLKQMGQEGLMGELLGRGADMQSSPIDLASAALPLLRGMKLLKAVKGGASGLRGIAAGMGEEFAQEASTEYLGDARSNDMQVLEAGAMGAVGSGVLEGGFATAGRVLRDRPGAEMAPMQTGNPQIDQVNAVLRASGPRPNGPISRTGIARAAAQRLSELERAMLGPVRVGRDGQVEQNISRRLNTQEQEEYDFLQAALDDPAGPQHEKLAAAYGYDLKAVNQVQPSELPMGNEGASDEDFDAFEQTRAPASQRPATTPASPFASVNDRNVPVNAPASSGMAQGVVGSTPAAGTTQPKTLAELAASGAADQAFNKAAAREARAEKQKELDFLEASLRTALMQGMSPQEVADTEARVQLLKNELFGNTTPAAGTTQAPASQRPATTEAVPSIDNIGRQFAPPQVRSVPVIPDNPLGYRDSLDFLNEMPIAISRSGTGGELDWQETANIPKYYRPFIANEQGLPIDVVAEAAYEANLIPQPTADALMKRVQEDIGARRTYRVQGREQKAELLTREKQTVSFDKSQTKLGNKPTAMQVPFEALATGDQLTIDGEQVTVRAVESDEGGYLTKVVLEDGKKFGVQEFNPQSREGVFVDAFDPKPRLSGDPEVFSPAQAGGAVPGGLTEAEGLTAQIEDLYKADEWTVLRSGEYNHDREDFEPDRTVKTSAARKLIDQAQVLIQTKDPRFVRLWYQLWKLGERSSWLKDYKDHLLNLTLERAKSEGWNYGYRLDPNGPPNFKLIAYIDTPYGQVSFHLRTGNAGFVVRNPAVRSVDIRQFPGVLDLIAKENEIIAAHPRIYTGSALRFWHSNRETAYKLRDAEKAVYESKRKEWKAEATAVAERINDQYGTGLSANSISSAQYSLGKDPLATVLVDAPDPVYQGKWSGDKGGSEKALSALFNNEAAKVSPGGFQKQELSKASAFGGTWPSEGTTPTLSVNPNLNPAALESPARGLGRGLGAILGQPPPGAPASQRPATTSPAQAQNPPAMSQALFDRARAVTSQQALPPVELEELFTRARNLLANDGSMELRPSDRTVIPQALAKLAAGENPQLIVNQWKQHRNDAVQGRTTAATPFAEYAQAPTDPGTPRARLLSAYAQLDRTGQGYVRIPDLVRASGLPIADVREVLIDLSDRNQAYLTPADEPRNIPASDRSLLVVGPSGPSLYVTLPDPAALASPAQLTAQDAAYLAAVEAGDMETAQRMVDEAAKAAGYNRKVWRGDDSEITEFNPDKKSTNFTSALGFSFSSDKFTAAAYGSPKKYFIKGRAFRVNYTEDRGVKDEAWNRRYDEEELAGLLGADSIDTEDEDSIQEYWEDLGKDIIRVDNIDDSSISGGGTTGENPATLYIVKSPNQIKSADPVTRDEQGNVIPLSQRFNSDSDSILYSPPTVSNRTVYKRNTTLNKAELARLGLPTDTGKSVQGQKPVKEAMSRIAKDMRLPTTVRRMAKQLQNADLSGLFFQVVADGRKEYTGLYQPLRGGQGELVVNLRHLGRGNVDPALNMAETLVHEVLHHATYRALRYPKNDVQRAAIGNLEQLRRRVKAVLGSQQMADFGYQTKNIDEFIAALFTQKPFQDALAAIPAEATPKTLVQQVRTMLDEAFRLLAEIVTGKKVPPGSVLDSAFQNALRLVEDGVRVAGNYQALPGGGMLSRTPSLHHVTPTPLQSVRAHHGTPHKVGKFSLSKIGTGEGAQAYGWGLYFAQEKTVAQQYRKLAKPFAVFDGVRLAANKGTPQAAVALDLETLNGDKQAVLAGFERDGMTAEAQWLRDNYDRVGFEQPGNLYTVELLPDEEDFLDWDKPLSEQSEKVKAALAGIGESPGDIQAAIDLLTPGLALEGRRAGLAQKQIDQLKVRLANVELISGAQFYNRIGEPKAASEALSKAGIPGIRYLDAGSRAFKVKLSTRKGPYSETSFPSQEVAKQYIKDKEEEGFTAELVQDGTRNYVIFDENLVRILEENGVRVAGTEKVGAPLASMAGPNAQPTGQVPSQAVPLKPEFGGAFPGHTPYQTKERQAWAAQEIATLSAEQLAQRVEAGQYGPVDKPFVLAAGLLRAEKQVRTATTQAGQIVAQTEVNRLRDLLNPQNSLAGQTLVAQRDALGEMRDRVPGLAVNEAVEKAQVQTIDAAIPVQPTVTGLADLTTQASTEATETVGGMLEAEGLGLKEADSTPQEQAAGEAVQSDLEAEMLRLKQMQTAERNQFSRLTTKLQKILATLQAFAGNKGAVIAGVKARLAARRAARANTVAANKLQSLSSPAQGITAPTLPDTALDDGLEVLLTQGIQIDDWKAAMTKKLGPKYASQLTDLYERAVDLYQAELTAAHAEVEKRVKEKKAKQKPTARTQPQRPPLAQSFPDLAKMLRKLGPAISGLNWRQIMTSTATAQRQWELDTYAQIRQHPRLSALSPEQAKELTRELSKAWQRERRKVWKRELDKTLIAAGMAKPKHRAKIEASAPRLLSLINLGALNAATFRDAVAKEFGLKSMTDADVLKVKALAEDLQNTPEGVPYRPKAQAFIEGLEDLTKIPAVQLLESYWTAAVLSGLRTQFDIFLGFANAIENTAGSVITALRTGQRQVIADTIFSTFARFPSAMAEGYQVLKTGKRGLTASYDQDIKGNLENGYITMGASARALIAKGALGKLPGYPMLMLARLMSASGHVTISMAYEGAKAMALARNADLYKRALNISAKDRENARQQARQVLTGGAMPANSEERAAEKAYARELLDKQFSTTEVLAQANEIAMEAALEGEVQQYSLGNMIVGLARYVNNIPQRAIDALEKDGAPRKQDKVLLAALRFAAPLARVVTGTKFIRTAGHAANRSLSYLPGLGLVRVVEKGMDGAKMDILMAQQIIGLSIGLGIYMLLPGPDDEEPQWGIEGGWKNLTPQQKSQLFSQGKQPFSLWWTDGKGKLRTVNYMNWGVSNVLAMVGTMQDQRLYLGKKDEMGIVMNGILTGLWQWQNRVSLQQLQILTGSDTAFGSKDVTTTFAERLNKFGATTVGGLIPRLAKDVDAMADPTLRRTDEWWQLWAREVPMVRQLTSGARIDILGNEIKIDRGPLSRITQAMIAPPEYRLVGALNARDVWLPDPSSSKPKVPIVGADPRDLTPLESDRYQRKAGQLAKDYILANGPQLLTLEPENAQDAIRKNAENWRKQALNWAVRK